MITLTQLTDERLLSMTLSLVKQERKLTLEILKHIREVESRRLYAKLGYSSLHKYLVQELKYSDGQAYRRMQAARLIQEVPEVGASVQVGEISLQVVCQIEKFAREQKLDVNEKRKVIEQAKGKSARELEQRFFQLSGRDNSAPDIRKTVSATKTELKITLEAESIKKLDRVKDLVAAKGLIKDSELIDHVLEFFLKAQDPLRRAALHQHMVVAKTKTSTRQRYVSTAVKKQIWLRAKGQCEFKGCQSTYGLELDHIRPISTGGNSGFNNLRLLCKAHNQYVAIQNPSCEKIKAYL